MINSQQDDVRLPTINPQVYLALACSPAIVVAVCLTDTPYFKHALTAALVGFASFITTFRLIPHFAVKLDKRGLSGDDLNKPRNRENLPAQVGNSNNSPTSLSEMSTSPIAGDTKRALGDNKALGTPSSPSLSPIIPRRPIPEALGVVPGFVYLVGGVLSYLTIRANGVPDALAYVSALLCVVFITFLGFVDDVCDLRWRYKVTLPLIASLPLLIIYEGPTTVIVPSALRRPLMEIFLPEPADSPLVLELGVLYYAYMAFLTIFCSNAINIYAGLNGLEVGQSIPIAVAIITHNTLEMLLNPYDSPTGRQHCLSLILNVVFLSCAWGLYAYNRFPSAVFVGDTFTYFAGVHFAVVGIMGHFAKTLLLFFLPQILNFVVSLPQLLGLRACPRHRVPTLNERTGKLEASPNLTVMNLTLRLFGPMKEKTLVDLLIVFQIVCCAVALAVRYTPIYKTLFL